jgi:integrase/recombinase XerC
MKKDIETKLYAERKDRLEQLPNFIRQFIMSKQEELSLNTQIAYLKDYTIFFEFLLTLPLFSRYKSIGEFTVGDMGRQLTSESESQSTAPQEEKRAYITEEEITYFLDHLNSFQKTFKRKDDSEYTQTFSNTKKGKARKLASLHTLYEYLGRHYKTQDVTAYIEIEIKKTKQIKERLSKEEVDRFTDIILNDVNIENKRKLKFHKRAKFRDITIVLLLAFNGIRVSELVQLDIDDINIKERAMIVIRKGGNQEKLYLPKEILPHLDSYITERRLMLGVDTKALFLSNQLKRIDPKTVRYMLNKYKKRAGINMNVTPHTFRRTFATKLLRMYGNIELVAQQLGHSTVETTRRFYAELDEETKKQAMGEFSYNE